jgi:hypothetical protein
VIEEHEEIPWSMLVEGERRARSRTWYAAAAIIVALVGVVAGYRWVEGHRHGEPAAPTAPAPATSSTLAETTTTTLLSEADLMAVEPAAAHLAAVARAEWFVTDYFTFDGSPAPEFLEAFPDDAVLPSLTQFGDGSAVSFVEWARAYAVRAHTDGYVVTVLFRTLYENAEGRFERSPVRAVDVVVLVADEQTAIADLPTPVEPPVGREFTGWPTSTAEASDAAVATALAYASRFTVDPALVESGSVDGEWRVVFSVDDPSGASIPMVVSSSTQP